MTNVIDFSSHIGTANKSGNSSQEKRADTVHRIIQPERAFQIFMERLTSRDIIAVDFFKILLEGGKVMIVNRGEEINLESILRVEKECNNIYEIGVNDFIRLTEPKPGIVGGENTDAYLIPALSQANVQISMITEAEDSYSESTFDEEDAEIFHADTIKAVWDDGFYGCMIDDLDDDGVSFTVDNFTSPMDMPLLYLLCHAHQEYIDSGYAMEGRIQMELARYEGIYTHTTFISIPLLEKIILAGIDRKYPLYSNFSVANRIKKFHDAVVFPLLSEEYLDGDEFE